MKVVAVFSAVCCRTVGYNDGSHGALYTVDSHFEKAEVREAQVKATAEVTTQYLLTLPKAAVATRADILRSLV